MMKRAAVSTSDSASTYCPPSCQYDGARDRDEEKHARKLKGEEVVLEERLGNDADSIQLLELLVVEAAGNDKLLRKSRTDDDHDLAEEAEADQPRCQLPTGAAHIRKLRRVSEVEQHHDEKEYDHDCTGIHQHLHDPDELSIEHDVERGKAEHRVHQPEC